MRRTDAYPIELRQAAFALLEERPRKEVARICKVSVPTIDRWKRELRDTGSLEPKKKTGGNPRKVTPQDEHVLRAILDQDNDMTLEAMAKELSKRLGKSVSPSSVQRALARMGITRKKSRSRRRRGNGPTSKRPEASTKRSSRRSTGGASTSSTRPARTRR
jgi:transposase